MATTPEQRAKILNAFVDSMIQGEDPDTQTIAKRVFGRKASELVSSVAAVRAHITMGTYGTVTNLKRRRRAELKRNSS